MNISFSPQKTKPPNSTPTGKTNFSSFCKKSKKPKGPKKPQRRFVDRRIARHDLHVTEVDDIYWPPIPGVDGPLEDADEVVGNLNKPPPRDPEEEAKYANLYVPSTEEIYKMFVEDGPPIFDEEDQ